MTEKTRDKQVALHHFAYFPGTALTAAVWTVLPEPLSDYRFFVLLFTLGRDRRRPACSRARSSWRLAGGASWPRARLG